MKWTGLTGGIATGKSTVKKLIEGLGFPVVDADLISHKLTEVGQPAYQQIVSHFGSALLNADESIDRKKLGQIIFSNPNQKDVLESILHPLIRNEVQNIKELHKKNNVKLCFYDVPLLFEKQMQSQFDTTILIWCSANIQLDRLMKRNQLTQAEAELRIANQMSLIDKVRLAHYCVDNSGDLQDLEQQIKRLVKSLT